ncbi:MAG TPA: flippase [Chryseosolibacter sp.]
MPRFISHASKKINQSYWLRSGSYTFMNKICVTFFGFVNFYILIRVLSREDFGAWVLFTSIATLMELIKHGFVRNPLIRYLAISPEKEAPDIQTASLLLNTVIGVIQVIFLYLCSIYLTGFWSAPQLGSLFRIYMITTILFVPVNHFDVMQQARMDFKGPFLSNLVRNAGLFIFILLVFFFHWQVQLDSFAYAQMAAVFLSCFVSLRYARPFLEFSKSLNRKWFRELHSYGVFTFGTNVSSMINKSVDSWMLGKLISPAAVTFFNPAVRISNLVEVPTDTLTSIFFPKLSERLAGEGPKAARYLYEKAVGTITAFMVPVVLFFIVFAAPVVRFVAGPGFEQTVPILQITMLYGLIIPFNRFFGVTLDAIGKAKMNFLFVLRNAAMNLVSNYFFISHFGIIGAAYATLTTYTLALIINQVYLNRLLNVRLSNILRHFFESYIRVFSSGVKFLREAF